MALKELDSFLSKFKNLLRTGRSANLEMKSSTGKVEVHLSVELDDIPPVTILCPQSRNGPARQRRREKRAAAREAKAAEEANSGKPAAVEESIEKNNPIDDDSRIEKNVAEVATDAATVNVIVETDRDFEELDDEFCPDDEFDVEINELQDETAEFFKLTFSDQGWSNENEAKMLNETEKNFSYTCNYYRVKREDRNFQVIKSQR
jgi:hypothetical protein